MGDGVLEDMMVGDGLTCAVAGVHMGVHGGNVAAEEGVSREEQDAWALRSHQRALAAQDGGLFAEEIVPSRSRTAKERPSLTATRHPGATRLLRR